MGESILKKEFKERDVKRMRNLVEKKYGDKISTQVGYVKSKQDYAEGEIFEENDKKWQYKSGIKMSVSKLDLIKKSLLLPLACPKCNRAMRKKQLDTKMYAIHKICFDCVIEMETELRRDGKYEEYVQNIIKNNSKSLADDIENDLDDFIKQLDNSETIIGENGDVEYWKGLELDKQKIKEEIQTYIQQLKEYSNS